MDRELVLVERRGSAALLRLNRPEKRNALNGPALAGGFALALLCDLRIAAPQATFGHEALEEVAQAPGAATAEIKRPILSHRDGLSPRDLLADEEQALRAALLATDTG